MYPSEVRKFAIQTYYRYELLIPTKAELLTHVVDMVKEKFDVQVTGDFVTRIEKRFDETCSLEAAKRKRDETTLEREIIAMVEDDDTLTLRVVANHLETNKETVRKVLRKHGYKPYKPFEVQKLTARNKNLRLDFCTLFPTLAIDVNKVWFSDEKIFCLSRRENHQNTRRWCKERPTFFNENTSHPLNVHTWCALSSVGIIGPFFFQSNVDQFEYQRLIDFEFIPALRAFGGPDEFWFQQDGATPHCTNYSLELLRVYFEGRLISRRAEIEWPPNSPDLNPLDFYLWGYLDAKVKKSQPKTVNQMKQVIKDEIDLINTDTLISVIENFKRRIQVCREQSGGHFVDIL